MNMNFFKTMAAAFMIAAIAFTGCRKDEPDSVKVTGVSLNESTLTLLEGQTATLVATVMPDDAADKTVTWAVTEGDAATVSDAGVVTAVKAGTATITVTTADGGKTATCAVTVKTEDTETSLERSNRIGKAGGEMIETAIAEAYAANAPVNVENILEEVKGIPGILSAELTPSGCNISIEMDDHTLMHMQIVNPADERFFPPVTTESKSAQTTASRSYAEAGVVSTPTLKSIENKAATQPNYGPKNGEKYRMLVLAPFGSDGLNVDEDFEKSMTAAGFAAFTNQDGGSYRYKDGEVDIEKFRGDFLNDFDYVLITTHGSADASHTFISTGIKTSENSPHPRMTVKGINYRAVIPQYIKATLNGEDFAGTHVFLAACESTQLENGEGSFVDMFMGNSAESIMGFKVVFAVKAVQKLINEMFTDLSGCTPLEQSVKNAKDAILDYRETSLLPWMISKFTQRYDENMIHFKQKPDAFYSFCAKEVEPMTMTMTTAKEGSFSIWMAGTGTAIINWGDGSEPEEVTLHPAGVNSFPAINIFHAFSGTTYRTIVIDGQNITHLRCNGQGALGITALESLDVTKNTALTLLDCSSNLLTSLDVSTNTALTYLDCSWNQLTSIDVTRNTALTRFECSGNKLTNLDMNNNTTLTRLGCHTNQLTSLDVTNCTTLTFLNCYTNQLTNLDVSNCTALTELYCMYNQLTSLDMSNNTALTKLVCTKNYQLTNLNVTKNIALTYLDCYDNQLTSLDMSNNTALTYLDCGYNQLTSLDVSRNTALTELKCVLTQLTSLDITGCTVLTDIDCSENQLTSLDVTKNTELTFLSCEWNQLTNIDVSKNIALTSLLCSKNQLMKLNVTNNTALTSLLCLGNELTSLDVTKNTELTFLSCEWNQLTTDGLNALFSTLHDNTNSKYIHIGRNPGTATCDKSIATDKGWSVN